MTFGSDTHALEGLASSRNPLEATCIYTAKGPPFAEKLLILV